MHIIEFKLSLFFIIFSQSDVTVNCKIEIRGDNYAEKKPLYLQRCYALASVICVLPTAAACLIKILNFIRRGGV